MRVALSVTDTVFTGVAVGLKTTGVSVFVPVAVGVPDGPAVKVFVIVKVPVAVGVLVFVF